MRGNVHVAAQRVNDVDFMVSLSGGFNQASGRVKLPFAGKYANFHFFAFFIVSAWYDFASERPLR
jgi:hypothetical protein